MFNNRLTATGILAAIGVSTMLLTLFGGFLRDVIAASDKTPPQPAQASFPHLAENLRNGLNQALAPEFPFNFNAAGNPFADKTGVSLAVADKQPGAMIGNSPAIAAPNQQSAQLLPGTPRNSYPKGLPPLPGGSNSPFPIKPGENVSAGVVRPLDPNELLSERRRLLRQGQQVGEIAGIYGIDDVRPIGVVGSGSRNRVLLFAPSTKQTFSVQKGTRFRDGTIEAFDNEGVQFKRDGGVVITSRWMKNSEKSAAGADPDAPFLRVPDSTGATRPGRQNSLPAADLQAPPKSGRIHRSHQRSPRSKTSL